MYKLKNNIVRVDASSKLISNERPSRNNNEQALRIPSCKTTARKDLFYPRTIKEWNPLPNCTRLVTYRAALLWTISNRWMSFCWYGSHTELAYSRVGLTRDMYAFSLIDLLEMFMHRTSWCIKQAYTKWTTLQKQQRAGIAHSIMQDHSS
jgi:hypothetical protein